VPAFNGLEKENRFATDPQAQPLHLKVPKTLRKRGKKRESARRLLQQVPKKEGKNLWLIYLILSHSGEGGSISVSLKKKKEKKRRHKSTVFE